MVTCSLPCVTCVQLHRQAATVVVPRALGGIGDPSSSQAPPTLLQATFTPSRHQTYTHLCRSSHDLDLDLERRHQTYTPTNNTVMHRPSPATNHPSDTPAARFLPRPDSSNPWSGNLGSNPTQGRRPTRDRAKAYTGQPTQAGSLEWASQTTHTVHITSAEAATISNHIQTHPHTHTQTKRAHPRQTVCTTRRRSLFALSASASPWLWGRTEHTVEGTAERLTRTDRRALRATQPPRATRHPGLVHS